MRNRSSDIVARTLRQGAGRLHRDQRGSISILTVFAVLGLTVLLGMVMNLGRQVDGKIRMQNAADNATYAGAVVMARQLNVLAFTNHLLSDTFALTAILREGDPTYADGGRIPKGNYVSDILAAWREVAPLFQNSPVARFAEFGAIIQEETQKEQEAFDAYCTWLAAVSQMIRPTLERVLEQQAIPRFQQDVVRCYPEIAQLAMEEAARRCGTPARGRGPLVGVLWTAEGYPVAQSVSSPIIDPLSHPDYLIRAREIRNAHANRLLDLWNNQMMSGFDYVAEMCRFNDLWRAFTAGQLERLKRQYANANLPMLLLDPPPMPEGMIDVSAEQNTYLDRCFSYVGVIFWRHVPEFGPGIFRNPSSGDSQAFAQARVFIPKKRLVLRSRTLEELEGSRHRRIGLGGVAGDWQYLDPGLAPSTGGISSRPAGPPIGFESRPDHWTLWNQQWIAQMVPANAERLPEILRQRPPQAPDLAPPNYGNLEMRDIRQINTH